MKTNAIKQTNERIRRLIAIYRIAKNGDFGLRFAAKANLYDAILWKKKVLSQITTKKKSTHWVKLGL